MDSLREHLPKVAKFAKDRKHEVDHEIIEAFMKQWDRVIRFQEIVSAAEKEFQVVLKLNKRKVLPTSPRNGRAGPDYSSYTW